MKLFIILNINSEFTPLQIGLTVSIFVVFGIFLLSRILIKKRIEKIVKEANEKNHKVLEEKNIEKDKNAKK